MCKNCNCEKLITSQRGPAGRDGADGMDGKDGVVDWKELNLECLENKNIVEPADSNDDISQKLVNFWCNTHEILYKAPIAYDNTYNVTYQTPLEVNPTLNDDYSGMIVLTIDTQPLNGTVSVSTNDNKTIIYTPNSGFSGGDSLVYRITDSNGLYDTATITFNVQASGVIPCANIDASFIADLNISNKKLKIQLVNTTDYETNVADTNNYLIEILDINDDVLYTYNVTGNNNSLPQQYTTAQNVTNTWKSVKITQTVVSKNGAGISCGSSTKVQSYVIPDIGVSFYEGVDVSCLGKDPEIDPDTEITQALVNKVCQSNSSTKYVTVLINNQVDEDNPFYIGGYVPTVSGGYFTDTPFGIDYEHTGFEVNSYYPFNPKVDNKLKVKIVGAWMNYVNDGGASYPDPIPNNHSIYNSSPICGRYVIYYTNGIDYSIALNLTVLNIDGKEWVEETLDISDNTWDITGQDLAFENNSTYNITKGKRIWKLENYTLKVKYSLIGGSMDAPNDEIELLLPIITLDDMYLLDNDIIPRLGFGSIANMASNYSISGRVIGRNISNQSSVIPIIREGGNSESNVVFQDVAQNILHLELEIPLSTPIIN